MAPRLAFTLAASVLAAVLLAPAGGAATSFRPPVTWLKGEGNFTKAHRSTGSIDKIVVHVTEGQFWGSVRWLKSPRAHASSHYVVSRRGKIVQLVHLSDIAWHAGNWNVNVQSVGIEHEGFTYGPGGFPDAQYHASARLAGWIARRALMPINRRTVIGHADVPAPGGGRGGASHHTDPGPHWNWNRYLQLVRRYAGVQKLSVLPVVPAGPLRGIIPWRAKATGDIRRVEFSIDGRVARVDQRAPFAFSGGLNTTRLANGRHVLQVHGIAGPGRYDIARKTIVVDNRSFALTSAGARPWTKVRGPVRLRVRPWGAKAAAMTFRVDGRKVAVDRRAPFLFSWSPARAKTGKHVLEVVAASVDGRSASVRIPLVVAGKPAAPKPKPAPVPAPLRIVSQSVASGQVATGLVLWRVELNGPARVEFLVDGVVRGADVAAPYTFGWNAAVEAPGEHRLTARATGRNGRVVEASVVVTVPATPAGTEAP
jgi:hypothetical protein